MKKVYFVFIKQSQDDYLVFVPDFEIFTQGNSLEDAIMMARDAIGSQIIALEEMGKELPKMSTYEEAMNKAKEDSDEFDFSDGIITSVDIDVTDCVGR